jgi:hypothetical protein
MVKLVDDISANALRSMVAGEVLDTAAPLGDSCRPAITTMPAGVKMKMAKLSGSNTVGQDTDGDGRSVLPYRPPPALRPDIPLSYYLGEATEAKSEVHFPLNFCPGVRWLEQSVRM